MAAENYKLQAANYKHFISLFYSMNTHSSLKFEHNKNKSRNIQYAYYDGYYANLIGHWTKYLTTHAYILHK